MQLAGAGAKAAADGPQSGATANSPVQRGSAGAGPSVRPAAGAAPGAAAGAEKLRPRGGSSAGGDDPEETVWEGGYSGKAMMSAWLVAFAVTVVIVVAAFYLDPFTRKAELLTAVAAVFWLVPLARLTYRKISIRYRLTNQRLFHEEGILRRTTNRVELIDADDVTVERGILDRLMNVGTVRVVSSDRTHPEVLLVAIEDALDVAEKIDAARRRERLRRGIHIEAV
jgi:membrane protein YdbS with pleckstrin-like domain